jgi:hypothetical protein
MRKMLAISFLAISAFTSGCVTSAEVISRSSGAQADAGRLVQLKALNRLALNDSGYTCKLELLAGHKALKFVGSTDRLNGCLVENALEDGDTLMITSPGGDIQAAIVAGLYISRLNLRVMIEGICLSSCANYIAPAAHDLTINTYSVLGLHGAPSLTNTETEARVAAQIQADGFLNTAEKEAIVKASISEMRISRSSHDIAARVLKVASGWYAIVDAQKRSLDTQESRPPMRIPSAGQIKSCLKGVDTMVIWSPRSQDDRNIVRSLYPTNTPLVFDISESGVACM